MLVISLSVCSQQNFISILFLCQSLLQILNKAESSIDPLRITIISSLETTIPLLAQLRGFPALAFYSQLSLQKPDKSYLHHFLLIKAVVLINRDTFTQPASPLVNLACILSYFPFFFLLTWMFFLKKNLLDSWILLRSL